MEPKIKILIENSPALSGNQKELYLKLVEMIPEYEVLKLEGILEDEVQKTAEIKAKGEAQRAAIYQKTILEVDDFFKKAETTAIVEQESSEKQSGEDLLNQLDNL